MARGYRADGSKLGFQKGHGTSPLHSQRLRESKLEHNNPMWKGDEVGYDHLHKWVGARIPKPLICPRCNERPTLDLANKGVYDRNLDNWEWLCRKCHMDSDGRKKNLKRGKDQWQIPHTNGHKTNT